MASVTFKLLQVTWNAPSQSESGRWQDRTTDSESHDHTGMITDDRVRRGRGSLLVALALAAAASVTVAAQRRTVTGPPGRPAGESTWQPGPATPALLG